MAVLCSSRQTSRHIPPSSGNGTIPNNATTSAPVIPTAPGPSPIPPKYLSEVSNSVDARYLKSRLA